MRYDISQRHVNKKKAFGGKVLELTVEPKYVGKRAAYQVPYLIMNAYKAMLKELPPNVNLFYFKVYSNSNRINMGTHPTPLQKFTRKETQLNGLRHLLMKYINYLKVKMN